MAKQELPPHESASALERLTAPDSLLEPNITQLLSSYLRSGGNPVQVVTSLSANYRGLPEMYRLLTDQWTTLFGLTAEETGAAVGAAVRDRIENSFDASVLDATYPQDGDMPDWLDGLLEDAGWRKMMYRLSERHVDCALLNEAIQRIAASGHRDEIAGLSTASSYLKVFSEVLFSALRRLFHEDDAGLEQCLPEFAKICCRNVQTYIFSQAVLYRLADEPRGGQLQRLRKALEIHVRDKRQSPELVRVVRALFSGLPADVANAISSVLERKRISPGDVVLLHRTYTAKPVPTIEPLRDAEFLDVLLTAVFTHPVEAIRKEIRAKYMWLLAFATAAMQQPNGEVDESQVEATQTALEELHTLLPVKYTLVALNTALREAIMRIDLPIASMAVLTWLRHVLLDTPFYETYFRVTEIPAPLLLMEEIVVRHPQQRMAVFQLLRRSFEMAVPNTSPQTLMALRRTLLDRMVALMYHGSVMTVLDYMNDQVAHLDESLVVHFTIKTLAMFQPPYRTRFYVPALHVYALAIDALLRQTATIVSGPTPLGGHSRTMSASNINASSLSANSSGTGASLGALLAPAEDAAEREKAVARLREFIASPPAMSTNRKRRRTSDDFSAAGYESASDKPLDVDGSEDAKLEAKRAVDSTIDLDTPLSGADMALLEEMRLKLAE
ncbi:TH1 protein-domain-containing protein [Thamnocephalis sphaerospora]|uniref:TH1 protein-domain-containing protein n=1 Tax=Thamnocephalis sphaerospora TaxID=78915 RepID=A0A4P9XII9_9FUNG|nr:TH1 protein-domain-containing protein [Thamnocephalis sphaerospora]RKP09331.1 TH1 protein-domain-containing protein [Thamnocephalis sphaerospora]|eukprot:RKP05516.1 TH1 protein-domain-containing protein [Thamnocephalis sphaerospora]